ncbi:MAG TPA: P-II family nitrogen regulator [Fimbriimonas sp.]|nr:P-II family nitrogen regulator [Fimbriimonas sp.]
MTKIEAYIRTHLLEAVHHALDELHVHGMTVIDVRGMGSSKGVHHLYRGSEYTLTLTPRLKLEIVVNDDQVEEVVEAIRKASYTGEVGDGKILTVSLGQVVRIRTGEKGEGAL